MKINHFIYLSAPFGLGLLAQKLFDVPSASYWFYVALLCLASVFVFLKMILPYHQQKFDAVADIDFKGAYEEKNREEKPYIYIVGFHMILFFVLLILYFTT
nr:hypothetical protein [uncultured Flavobacterium sp.]